jgi:hypothetical protein
MIPTQSILLDSIGEDTWQVPINVYSITVECWGAGGGGGVNTSTPDANRVVAGGGGGYARSVIGVTPGQTFVYTVGYGGEGRSGGSQGAGSNGGQTVFTRSNGNAVIIARGGYAGNGLSYISLSTGRGGGYNWGLDAPANFGDVTYVGGSANAVSMLSPDNIPAGAGGGAGSTGDGNTALQEVGSAGGAAKEEYGGKGGDSSIGTSAENGEEYGGGGGGIRYPESFESAGNGANGLIRITYDVTPVRLLTTVGSGSYTKPAGVSTFIVECWGGGGAAFGNDVGRTAGGAGGQYSRKQFDVGLASSSFSYIVGAGGGFVGIIDNYERGTAGGDTIFGDSDVVAKGGAAGGQDAGGQGSTTGGVGDVVYRGGNGAITSTGDQGGGGGGAGSTGNGNNAVAGTGGAARDDFGGKGGNGRISSTFTPAEAGGIYGGGGGGNNFGAAIAIPAGGQGLIRITEYFAPSVINQDSDNGGPVIISSSAGDNEFIFVPFNPVSP